MAPPSQSGQVEIRQVEEKAWSVEVKDVGFQSSPSESQKTAAVTR
jgi:hypothetical protein